MHASSMKYGWYHLLEWTWIAATLYEPDKSQFAKTKSKKYQNGRDWDNVTDIETKPDKI